MKRPLRIQAFSLVEVVMAVGIVSFCLLAIVGLLPVGLKSVQNANEQAGAAQILNGIAESLRNARSQNGTYTFAYAGQNATYSLNGSSATHAWTNLTLEGTTNNSFKRVKAQLDYTPPASISSPGRATVSVAWTAQAANLAWNSANQSWSGADGSLTSGLVFLVKP